MIIAVEGAEPDDPMLPHQHGRVQIGHQIAA